MKTDHIFDESTRIRSLASIGLGGWLGTNSGLTGGLGLVYAALLIQFAGTPAAPFSDADVPVVVALSVALAVLHWTVAIGLWQQRYKLPLLWSVAIVLLVGGIAAAVLSGALISVGSRTNFVAPAAICAGAQGLLGGIIWLIDLAVHRAAAR